LPDFYCLKHSQITNLSAHKLPIYNILLKIIRFDTPDIMILSFGELISKLIDVGCELFKQSFGLLWLEPGKKVIGDGLNLLTDFILVFGLEAYNRIVDVYWRVLYQEKFVVQFIVLYCSDSIAVFSVCLECIYNILIFEHPNKGLFFYYPKDFFQKGNFVLGRRRSDILDLNPVL